MGKWWLVGVLTLLAVMGSSGGASDKNDINEMKFWSEDFGEAFEDLMDANNYEGATVAVMRNGALLFAEGYGILGEKKLHASSVLPISSHSKILTAVAVMKMVQDGKLSLSARVFGKKGLLSDIKPGKGEVTDARIHDITVEHLLHHSAGWDSAKKPLYDPMLNQFFLYKKYDGAVDIAKEIGIKAWLNQNNIISYMLSKPLDYTPGTKSKYSNLGYSVLGRIIEQVSGLTYQEYVKKHILIPAGMMNTQVGPRFNDEYQLMASRLGHDMNEVDSQYMHSIVSPALLDSCLGWYSNVFDLSRFYHCLYNDDNRCRILAPKYVKYMLQKPSHMPDAVHADTYRAVGVHVTNEGVIWQDSDIHDNDVILYHSGDKTALATGLFDQRKQMKTWPKGFDLAGEKDNITVIALMANNRYKKLRSSMERLYDDIVEWPEDAEDLATADLADSYLAKTQQIIRFSLDEHKVAAFANAIRIAGYYPQWMQAYTWDGATYFVALAKYTQNNTELDYKLEVSSSTKHLYNHGADLEEDGYKISLVQSYKSFSHDSMVTHLLFAQRRGPKEDVDNNQWSYNTEIDQYLIDLRLATKKGYSVAVQSIESHGREQYVTYVLEKVPSTESNYISYHEVTLEQLEALVKSQALDHYHLHYLDSYRKDKQTHFSAIFRKGKVIKWLLQTDIAQDKLPEQSTVWQTMGYQPRIICGYEEQGEAYFVGLWIKE